MVVGLWWGWGSGLVVGWGGGSGVVVVVGVPMWCGGLGVLVVGWWW